MGLLSRSGGKHVDRLGLRCGHSVLEYFTDEPRFTLIGIWDYRDHDSFRSDHKFSLGFFQPDPYTSIGRIENPDGNFAATI